MNLTTSVKFPDAYESLDTVTPFVAEHIDGIIASGETIEIFSRESFGFEINTQSYFFEKLHEIAFSEKSKLVAYQYAAGSMGLAMIFKLNSQVFLAYEIEVYGRNREKAIVEIKLFGAENNPALCSIKKLWENTLSTLPNPDIVKEEGTIFILQKTQSGYKMSNVGQVPLKFKECHYMPNVVKKYNFAKEQIVKDNPRGRLVILEGPPGTGKTSILRSMFTEMANAIFINFPAIYLNSLEDPQLIQYFAAVKENYGDRGQKIILVLEDADSCLVPRENGNISLVSTLLNACDGIIGAITDLRVIATTNAKFSQIDSAITRPGRLITHIEVGKLSPEAASACYKEVTGSEFEFHEEMTLAEIYQIINFTEEERALYAREKQPKRQIGFK